MVTARCGSQRDSVEISRDTLNQLQRIFRGIPLLTEITTQGIAQSTTSTGTQSGSGSGTDQQTQTAQVGIFGLLPRAEVLQDALVLIMHNMVDLFDRTTQGLVDLLAGRMPGSGTGQSGTGQGGTTTSAGGQSSSGQASTTQSQSGPVGGVIQHVLPDTPRGGSAAVAFQVANDAGGRVNDVQAVVWGDCLAAAGMQSQLSPSRFLRPNSSWSRARTFRW